MKTALFGATGKTGRLVLQEIMSRGWSCTALVRAAPKLTPAKQLTMIEGDARDADKVASVVAGSDVVFCCLGMHDITQPATDFSDSVKTVIRAMQACGVKRLIAIASARVFGKTTHSDLADVPAAFRNVVAEHLRNAEAIAKSGLHWTVMCPVYLVEDIPAGHAQMAYDAVPTIDGAPGKETGYADLAQAMVELAKQEDSFGRRIGIVSARP